MAASKDDLFMEVGNPGTATTLSAPGYTVGNTTITVGSTTNWATNTGVCFSIYETEVQGNETVMVAGTYNEYFGTVASATGLANVEHVTGSGTDRNYSAGATTVVTILYSAGRENRLVEGLLVSHDQDGTLKADSVDVTAVIKDDIVSNAKLSQFKPSEVLSDFIYSGGVVAQSAGLVGTFSNIVYYIGGIRYTATSVANKTYTASKDTYVDINTSGTVTYTEVANNAASPALTASNIRVAKVVTNGSAITSVAQNGVDSLGNKIYNLAMDIKRSLPVLSRQGGNASSWSTGGTSNYDTRGLGVFIQTGAIAVNANPTTVTFPVPFSQPPVVVATTASAGSAQAYMIVTGQTATACTLRAVNENGTAVTTEYADWVAIGI